MKKKSMSKKETPHPMLHGQNTNESKKWIQSAIKSPGSLRKTLHAKKGQNIPESALKKAEHSKNPITRKRANLAVTLKKMHHKKK